jgi:hypothetical protein
MGRHELGKRIPGGCFEVIRTNRPIRTKFQTVALSHFLYPTARQVAQWIVRVATSNIGMRAYEPSLLNR